MPGFPGKDLPAFVAVCVLLFGAQIAAVAWVTGTQEVEAAGAETPTTPEPTTPTTTPAETTTTEATTTAPATDPGDATAGKVVFMTTASPSCAACHTLSDAGATGSVGPNLDEKKPPYSLVIDRVTHGKGVMPSFSGSLSATDIENVAKYVSTVAGT